MVWNSKGGVWAAKGGCWHWFEEVSGAPILRSRCGTLLFANDAERDAATNRDPDGPITGWPCTMCARLLQRDAMAPEAEQIAILGLLLDIATDSTRYDAAANRAVQNAYARFKAGDHRIRFAIELEPGVWATNMEGDPGRTVAVQNAETYSARGAIAVLAHARRYRPFRWARIVPIMEGQCEEN